MTKEEWLATLDPEAVFQQQLRERRVGARRWRLAAIGLCRQVWPLLTDARSRTAVDAAERYADGLLTPTEAMTVETAAARVTDEQQADGATDASLLSAAAATCLALWAQPDYGTHVALTGTRARLGPRGQMDVLKCLFRVPDRRPGDLPSAWLSSTVGAMAAGIYADRAFDRLPILADALEDAGCSDPDVLGHCRCDGPHFRGCWVIDMLLGKQ